MLDDVKEVRQVQRLRKALQQVSRSWAPSMTTSRARSGALRGSGSRQRHAKLRVCRYRVLAVDLCSDQTREILGISVRKVAPVGGWARAFSTSA